MMNPDLDATLAAVADFYDQRPLGYVGPTGFRRTTRLADLAAAVPRLLELGALVPGQTRFVDVGCGDARVNIFFSYLAGHSLGVELEDWILDEHSGRRAELEDQLRRLGYPLPPANTQLFCGDSLAEQVWRKMEQELELGLTDIDLFYTFLCLHQEVGSLLAKRGRPGAFLMVYGLDLILPEILGLRRLDEPDLLARRVVLYQKL